MAVTFCHLFTGSNAHFESPLISLEPNSPALAAMLGEIFVEEDAAGRHLLKTMERNADAQLQQTPLRPGSVKG